MKLAVIGSGISGLSAAWLAHRDLSGDFDVRLFEKDSRIGGHAHTVTAEFSLNLSQLIRALLFIMS